MKKKTYIIIAVFLAYSALLAVFSSGSFPEKIFHGNFWPYLADKPISEDGFYLLTVAEKISKGEGVTYNFHVPTTGIQPLVVFIYSGIAKLNSLSGGDKFSFLRAIIFFNSLLLVVFSCLIFVLLGIIMPDSDKDLLFLLCLVLTTLNFELFILFNNGLETGINLIFITLLLIVSLKFISSNGIKNLLVLSIITGLVIMARIDSVIVVAAIIIYSFFTVRIKLSNMLLFLFVVAAIISPWFIYVYNQTNSLFPSSMQSQVSVINYSDIYFRFTAMMKALLEHITFFIYTGNKDIVLYIYSFVIIFLLVRAELRHRAFMYLFKKNKLIFWFGSALLFQALVYVIFSSAPYFYFRYTAPYIILFIIMGVTLLINVPVLKQVAVNRFVLCSLVVIFFVNVFFYFHSGKLGVHQSLRAGFIKRYFSDSVKVGCFQSGAAGFFNENVYNLDGKIDYNAYISLSKGEILKYIDREKIDVLIEWKEALQFVNHSEHWEKFKYQIMDGKTLCLTRLK